MKYFSILIALLVFKFGYANTTNDKDYPLNHCYHWLNEASSKYLSYKYEFAAKNNGELTFFTTPQTSNGSVAGEGLYCGKTPLNSISYGDRVIRIDLVDDVVLTYNGKNYCGLTGATSSECDKKSTDILYYNDSSKWFVIKNPKAVKSWSSNSKQLIADLKAVFPDTDYSTKNKLTNLIDVLEKENDKFKKIYVNLNSRFDLKQIIADVNYKNVSPLSILEASIKNTSVFDSENHKNKVVKDQITRMFNSTDFNWSQISDEIKKEYSDLFKSYLKQIAKNTPAEVKSATNIFNGLINYDLNVPTELYSRYWIDLFSCDCDLDPHLIDQINGEMQKTFEVFLSKNILNTKHVPDGVLLSVFDILHTKLKLKKVNSKEKLYLDLLNKTFVRLSQSEQSWKYLNDNDFLTNLNKIEYYDDLVTALVKEITNPKNKYLKTNSFFLYWLVSNMDSKNNDKKMLSNLVTKYFDSNEIYLDSVRTYTLLDKITAKKVIIPEGANLKNFILNLIKRSLQEHIKYKTDITNNYRMLTSGIYDFMHFQLSNVQDLTIKDKYFDYMIQSLESIAIIFDNTKDSLFKEYAYGLLQTTWQVYKDYTLEENRNSDFLKWDQTNGSLDVLYYKLAQNKNIFGATNSISNFSNIIVKSLDAYSIRFLFEILYLSKNTELNIHGVENASIIKINSKMILDVLNYLNSAEFDSRIKSEVFQIANHDKQKWNNIYTSNKVKNRTLKIEADICYFIRSVLANSDGLLNYNNGVNPFPTDLVTKVKLKLNSLNTKMCKDE